MKEFENTKSKAMNIYGTWNKEGEPIVLQTANPKKFKMED